MKTAVLQAVIEVPMSRRQARAAAQAVLDWYGEHGLEAVKLTGHSILRGLSFVELTLAIREGTDLLTASRSTMTGFVISAESAASAGESEEFGVAFAEVFWEGQEHLPESVILEPIADRLGIGGTDVEKDMRWAQLLPSYYNPVTRTPHEVRIRRSKVT